MLLVGVRARAALSAFAFARPPAPALVSAAAVAAVALDLRLGVTPFEPTDADPDNGAYAAIEGPGRLLELPAFLPDRQEGSVYAYYLMQSPRERPSGYSTSAPPEADAFMRRLRGRCPPGEAELRAANVRHLLVHGAYGRGSCDAALRAAGCREIARGGEIRLFRAGDPAGGA